MKRRQSGSGGARKKAQAQTKFKYELVRYNENGELFDLSEQEMEAFKSKNAAFVARWMAETGDEEATWQSQCRRCLEYIMVRARHRRAREILRAAIATPRAPRVRRARRRRRGSSCPSTRSRSS